MTKSEVYDKLNIILSEGHTESSIDIGLILSYLCDYFSTNELEGLLNHIKEERDIE